MNVYRVVSEPIAYHEIIDPEIGGPWYDYRIAEIVAAPTRGRAKWLAWQSDEPNHYSFDVRDMPKFSVVLVRKNENWSEGVVDAGLEYLWTERSRPYLLSEAALIEDYLCSQYETEFGDCLCGFCGEEQAS